jgi:alpha-galactosidase
MDLLKVYKDYVESHPDGMGSHTEENWVHLPHESKQRVKFDLFRRYGAIAAAGDRHLAEFLPPWYTRDPETVRRWKFGLTTVDWRVNDLARRMKRSDDLISGAEEITLKGSGEEGHLLIKAILGLGDLVSNVNIPNRGQIENLPLGAVVETNALFGYDRIEPVHAGKIPENVLPLIARHVYNQENTLKAAMTCDRKLGLSTFMNDPQMGAITPEDGEKLFNDMLENQRKWLPKEWFPGE